MADLSARVAIIALVVSLIALLIALGQLLGQVFGTAEGYRRCSEAVVGPWHRLRWRKWFWTEFRYETNFITPKILLHAPDKAPSICEPLRRFQPSPEQMPRYWDFLWFTEPRVTREVVRLVVSATLDGSSDANGSSDEAPITRFTTAAQVARRTSDRFAAVEKGEHEIGPPNRNRPGAASTTGSVVTDPVVTLPNENKASWLRLIRALHCVSRDCYIAPKPKSKISSTFATSYGGPRETNQDTVVGTSATEVMIGVSRWTWDLMPNEMAKPLATTTLGAIIVFGVRLGMQWRSLDKRTGQILADGNGYSMCFVETPGLGVVAKLSITGRTSDNQHPRYVHGQVADKMACGILQGCAHFVDRDISVVSDEREVYEFGAILRGLACNYKYTEDAIAEAQSHGRSGEADNDVLCLLSEQRLVEGQNSHEITFHGFAARPSFFRFWEARLAMLRHLKNADENRRLTLVQRQVLTNLIYLADEYPSDFYCLNGRLAAAAQDGNESAEKVQKQVNLQHDCRVIFDFTTKWLRDKAYDKRDSKNISRYVHLVIAHWCMASKVHDRATKALEERRKEVTNAGKRWKRRQKHQVYGLDDVPVHYNFFTARMFEVARAYIDDVTHPRRSHLHDYMRDLEFEDDESNLQTAWWVLMLRGLAWDLPIVENTVGEPIPSCFYDDKTPVWIT